MCRDCPLPVPPQTAVDTSPEAVVHAVARWHGYARYMPESNAKALLIDACDLIDALARERDLAVAHDRQAYPTAESYERTCAALAHWRQRAERAEATLAEGHGRALAADAATRARRDAFETHPTLRDWREGQAR